MKNEQLLQASCIKYFQETFPWRNGQLFAINNNSHNVTKGRLNRQLGVVAGVSDLVLICENGKTIWIELKTVTGTQSLQQVNFSKLLLQLAHKYVVIRTLDDFIELVNEQMF